MVASVRKKKLDGNSSDGGGDGGGGGERMQTCSSGSWVWVWVWRTLTRWDAKEMERGGGGNATMKKRVTPTSACVWEGGGVTGGRGQGKREWEE